MELSGHADNHVIEIRVEVLSLGDFHSIWGLEVVAGHDVVDIVCGSGSESDLEKVSGPDTSVGVLSLILGVVRGIHVIVDISVSLIPLLVVILFEVLMGRVDSEVLTHPGRQLQLLVRLVQKHIVLLGDHAVAVAAVSGEDLETSSDAAGVESAEELELGPVQMAVVGSYFGDLLFVALDTPEGANVVSVDEALGGVLLGGGGITTH